MKRLPEQYDPRNADEAYIAALLQNVHPFEPSVEQMQRVWTTLERSEPRRPRGRVSGVVVAALVLCGATIASATMSHVWKRHQQPAVEAAPAPVATVEKAVPRRAPPVTTPAPAVLPEPISQTAALPAQPPPQPAPAVRRSTSSKSPTTVPPQPTDSSTSAMLMVEAIRERRAGNLARARELANEYRTKNPSGPLYEEALALSFQAAAVVGDGEAKQLARLYIERYARGRFRAQAQRVLDDTR